MADIQLNNLTEGSQILDPEAMRGIYGGAGADAGTTVPSTPTATNDPNQIPVVPVAPDGSLPGQGDAGAAGGGGGGSCQL